MSILCKLLGHRVKSAKATVSFNFRPSDSDKWLTFRNQADILMCSRCLKTIYEMPHLEFLGASVYVDNIRTDLVGSVNGK